VAMSSKWRCRENAGVYQRERDIRGVICGIAEVMQEVLNIAAIAGATSTGARSHGCGILL